MAGVAVAIAVGRVEADVADVAVAIAVGRVEATLVVPIAVAIVAPVPRGLRSASIPKFVFSATIAGFVVDISKNALARLFGIFGVFPK